MSDWLKLREAWQYARTHGERTLLFTIVDIEGSSYRKLAAHMLVTQTGRTAGGISAGCLEADLLLRAPSFFESRLPQVISYDNRDGDIFALNQGCSGAICILVEEIFADELNPLTVFESASEERRCFILDTVFDSAAASIGTRSIACCMLDAHPHLNACRILPGRLGNTRSLVEHIPPPINVITFGAQTDADAVARLAEMADMQPLRPDKIRADRLSAMPMDSRTAVVLMSHNYEEDKAALAAVLDNAPGYIGVMGPRKRTQAMLAEIEAPPIAQDRLHFPVGLDIGADGPNQIAISIVGEIMSVMGRMSASSLKVKSGAIHLVGH